MKRIIIYSTLLFLTFTAFSQEETAYNFYHINSAIVNPAATAKNGGIDVFVNYRDQWSGLKGAPEHQYVGVKGSINKSTSVGLIYNGYSNGMLRRNNISASYAYSFNVSETHLITLGLSGGMYSRSISKSSLSVESANDPSTFSNDFEQTYFKTGFGLCYSWKSLSYDFAVPEIFDMGLKRSFTAIYTNIAYQFDLNEKVLSLTPSVAYRYKYQTVEQFDFALKANYQQKVWAQMGYRTKAGIISAVGISLKSVIVGYSYEFVQSPLSSITSGSNEFTIIYTLPFKLNKDSE